MVKQQAQNLCRSCVSWTKGNICSIRKQMGSYSVIWSYAGLMRKKPGNTGPYKTIRDHSGPYVSHQRASSINVRLPSKFLFHQRPSSINLSLLLGLGPFQKFCVVGWWLWSKDIWDFCYGPNLGPKLEAWTKLNNVLLPHSKKIL